jgi:predicted GNAT superfamily acetyltransferase
LAVSQTKAAIELGPLDSQEKILAAVALQKQVWGFDDIELLPVRLFVTAQKIGGQTFGAFDGQKLIGFCLAIPGIKPSAKPGGVPYLHSHMLAVADAYRDYGIGRRLKLYQREDALARGISLMEWTFDPLEIKNAYFNIERLGAIVRRFTRNQYGTTSSHLHGGLPTDRLTAEWWMDSDRVNRVLSGELVERASVVGSIPVPTNASALRSSDPERVRALQSTLAEQFEKYFDSGLAVTAFEKTETTGNYLIGRWK